jgi:MoaA/NifB/PqqE/SkfB family radical SAM enzyme
MKAAGISIQRSLPIPWHLVRSAALHGGPFKATLAATSRCPHRCAHCGIFRRNESELPAADYARLLYGLDSLVWVDLTGGEVLEREDCCELVSHLVEQLPALAIFHFPTSGDRPDAAEKLARHASRLGLSVVVSVSIDGPEELHDRLRGKPGAFRSAVETLHLLRRIAGIWAYAGTTLLPQNLDVRPAALHRAVRAGCPGLAPSDWHVNVMQRSDHYFDNHAMPLPDRRSTRKALLAWTRFRGLPTGPFAALELAYQGIELALLSAPSLAPPTCSALRSSVFVSPSGRVYPCHIWGECLGVATPDRPVRDLLASERGRWLRSLVSNGLCPRCWTPCEAYPTLINRVLDPLRIGG